MCDVDATRTPKKRRIRFNETTEPVKPTANAFDDFLSSSFESLPATSKTRAIMYCKKLNSLCNQQRAKQKVVDKFTSDFVPRSAKVGFTLTASKRVEETEEFKTHSEEVKTAINEFQQKMANYAKIVANKELELLKEDMCHLFFDCLYDMSMLTLIQIDSKRENQPVRALCLRILEEHHDKLMEYLEMTDADMFRKYQEHFNEANTHAPGSLDSTITVSITDTINPTAEVIRLIFVEFWNKITNKHKDQEMQLAMDLFIKERSTSKATAETAMEIEKEPTVSSETMNKLIEEAVQKQTKELRTKVNTLQNRMSSKNSRGASPARASSKKKNAASKKKETSNKSNNNSKKKPRKNTPTRQSRSNSADDASSVSSADSRQSRQSRSPRRQKQSKNRKRNGSKTSKKK